MKMNQRSMNIARRSARNVQVRKAVRQEKEHRSWLGFYTHTALPMIALTGDFKQEQC